MHRDREPFSRIVLLNKVPFVHDLHDFVYIGIAVCVGVIPFVVSVSVRKYSNLYESYFSIYIESDKIVGVVRLKFSRFSKLIAAFLVIIPMSK